MVVQLFDSKNVSQFINIIRRVKMKSLTKHNQESQDEIINKNR